MKKTSLKITLVLLSIIMTTAVDNIEAQRINPAEQQWNVYVTPILTAIPKCTMIYYSDNHFAQCGSHTYRLLYS